MTQTVNRVVTISADLCVRCGKCKKVCPTQLAQQVYTRTFGQAEDGRSLLCLRCGHCMASCPEKAILVEGLRYEDMPDARQEPVISKDGIISYVKERRSIRCYTDEIIPDEDIIELLNVVEYAASGHNQHKCKWGVLKGKRQVRVLADAVIEVLDGETQYADIVQAYRDGKNSLTRDASHLIFAYMPTTALVPVEDGTVAMELLEILLPAFGLGGCWGGYMTIFGNQNDRVRQLLHVPPQYKLVGTMLLGYPAPVESYLRIPTRKKAEINFFGG